MFGKHPWHAHSMVTCCNIIQDGCEQCKRPSLPTIFHSSKQSIKGVACEISKRSESRNQCYVVQQAERVDVHACKTLSASGLREALFWPRNGLRSDLIASKFQKFSAGACPQLLHAYICTTNLTTPNLMATALICKISWHLRLLPSHFTPTSRLCVHEVTPNTLLLHSRRLDSVPEHPMLVKNIGAVP